MHTHSADPLDRTRFPLDDWALTERGFHAEHPGHTETLFSIGNGYLGFRGNTDDGIDGHEIATLVNGFCETWPIKHAEDAFGLARVGQSILSAPDPRPMRIAVDGHVATLHDSGASEVTRSLDFRTGTLHCSSLWQSPAGNRIRIESRRLVSCTRRHVAVLETNITALDDAEIAIETLILNRQDVAGDAAESDSFDPRKGERFESRVLQPRGWFANDERAKLAFSTTHSGLHIVVSTEQQLDSTAPYTVATVAEADVIRRSFSVSARAGDTVAITTFVSIHDGVDSDAASLAEAASATLDAAVAAGAAAIAAEQRAWLDDFWRRTDIEIPGQPALQQALRWNLLQIAFASACANKRGVAAKGLSGTGYGGHSFWDTETYVMPMLTYTSPSIAANLLGFRTDMLPAARRRAAELSLQGALYPWRTITGDEASAYYPAGTAQFHINADIAHALMQYVHATGDDALLDNGGIDILVETARMWLSLGFWSSRGTPAFHIHGVTGPDEYTAVVNDNCYTNVMARGNLRAAVRELDRLRARDLESFAAARERLEYTDAEVAEFQRAAEGMFVAFDEASGLHPQDAQFFDKQVWDLANTPASKRPLLLHFHPLVIYRHQVLKQADVVLAMLLQSQDFSAAEKRRNFSYYDAITTGDSTLSAVVQSIMAAEVHEPALALDYFTGALFTDLGDLHHNTADGVHVASAAGTWSAAVFGFAGMRDAQGTISFDPRLPRDWDALRFRITLRGTLVRVHLDHAAMQFDIVDGDEREVWVRGRRVHMSGDAPTRVALGDES